MTLTWFKEWRHLPPNEEELPLNAHAFGCTQQAADGHSFTEADHNPRIGLVLQVPDDLVVGCILRVVAHFLRDSLANVCLGSHVLEFCDSTEAVIACKQMETIQTKAETEVKTSGYTLRIRLNGIYALQVF